MPVARAETESETKETRNVFVVYPWTLYDDRGAYKAIYTQLETPLKVKFVFAEDRLSSGHILDKVGDMIRASAFGIYDVSGWNPNVTLEYGMARGMQARSYIAFNPDKTNRSDVPADVRGYDRLQYGSFEELNDKVASLVRQELGLPESADPLEADRLAMLDFIRRNPDLTAREIEAGTGFAWDYLQLLLGRSWANIETAGATRATRYRVK